MTNNGETGEAWMRKRIHELVARVRQLETNVDQLRAKLNQLTVGGRKEEAELAYCIPHF
jgi:hypothetical protein